MTRSRRIAAWAVVVAIAIALTWARIWLIDHLRDQGWFTKYLVFADAILAGRTPVERIGDVSPAYLWLMVVARWIGLGVHAIRNVQIVALTFAAALCAYAAKQLGGWTAAVVAAVLILGNRAALVIATELEPETVILVLNAAAIVFVLRRKWLLAGLLIGLSTVARPVGLAILLFIACWALMESRRAAAILVAAALVPIATVLIVNASLTGNVFIMQPGGQFYEANNPLATGCAGVLPRIVADLNVAGKEPDYLHVAYRLIAARANGGAINAKAANRYWSTKAFAFLWRYPQRSMELFAWKAVLSVHHYDIYDLITTKRKSMELGRIPAIPFGVAFVLALAAFALRGAGRPRRLHSLLPVALFAAATVLSLVIFNVSARQRNALLAPLAILGGVGVAEIVALARARDERALIAFGAVMILVPLLGIEGSPMTEDAHNWSTALQSSNARAEAFRARGRGQRAWAVDLATIASILDTADQPLVSAATLRNKALALAAREESPRRLFDIAIALEKAGAWRDADAILAGITSYRPRRENRAVSSVAYYRARAALHLRSPEVVFRKFIDAAEREAPGDPDVLALRALTVEPASMSDLDAMHDPFTRDFAIAGAALDLGDRATAMSLYASIARRMPEWSRPRHALRTASALSGSSGVGR